MTRSKKQTDAEVSPSWSTILRKLFKRDGSPDPGKIVAAALPLVVVFAGIMFNNIGDDVQANKAALADQKVDTKVLGVRLDDLESNLATTEASVGRIKTDIGKARRDLDKVKTLLRDLAELRDQLQEGFNRR